MACRMDRSAVTARPGIRRAAGGPNAGRGVGDRYGTDAGEHQHGRAFSRPAVRRCRRGATWGQAGTGGRAPPGGAGGRGGATLADVLARTPAVRDAGVNLTAAFDLAPAVAAAARWVDPALQHAASVRERLGEDFVTSKQREATLTRTGNQVLGTWKLRSYEREELATGKRHNQFGDHPDGYLGYAPDGRMYAMFIRQDRIMPRDVVPTEEEGVQLIGSMVAYGGTYTLGERQVVHHIDISWNQNWTGTDQVRFFELDGDVLTITTAPYHSHQDGKEGRSILVWDRVPPRVTSNKAGGNSMANPFGLSGR